MADTITAPAPINPSDPGDGPLLMGVTWALTFLCIMCIGTRFYLRNKISRSIASDDWFMLAAGVFQVTYQAGISEAYRWGLGKDDENVAFVPNLVNALKWTWVSATFGILVSILARISITILLARLFGVNRPFKWFLYIFTTLQSIVATVLIIIIWVQVDPLEGLWDPRVTARRWDPTIQQYTAYLSQSLFTFSDLTYVLFPVMIIWSLNMPIRRRIGLVILMGFSLFTMVASIMKTATAQSNKNGALSSISNAVLWASVEQSLVAMMGCVPVLASIAKLEWVSKIRASLTSLTSRLTPRSVSHDEEMNSLKPSQGTNTSRDRREHWVRTNS